MPTGLFQKSHGRISVKPLISVVMPVYNTPEKWLTKAIESVRNQIYPHWELCISDNASTLVEVRKVLDHYARLDSRIHVIYRETNGHISANSNTALTLAKGEFIALLDSDDELSEHALYWVAHEINQHPDVDLIYSDEDKISEDGVRFEPYFKPDWNPALMLSQNTFSHLGVYRYALVKRWEDFGKDLKVPKIGISYCVVPKKQTLNGSVIYPGSFIIGVPSRVDSLFYRRKALCMDRRKTGH